MRTPRRLALAGLLVLTSTTASAALPPPNIQIQSITPTVGDTLVYLPLAAPSLGAADAAQLSIDLYMKNLQPAPQLIQLVQVQFPGSAVAGFNLTNGLELRCPTGSDALDDPILPPNVSCRLSLLPDMKIPNPGPAQAAIKIYVFGNPTPLVINRPMAAHVNATPTGSYRFPARAEDLPPGTFWSGQSSGAGSHHRAEVSPSNMLAYDLGVVRWDEDQDKWVATRAPEDGETDPDDENDDYLVWDVPVYAMADGEVKGCSDGNEDNPVGVDTGAVNSLTIQHGDEKAWYGHLRNGSIDPAICFDGAIVSAGQFLGRAGNSGKSSAPHLHVHVTKGGNAVPLLFSDVFTIDRNTFASPPQSNMPWSGVKKAGLLWEKALIWPSPLRRHDAITGVDVDELVLASSSAARKVTLARDASGDLRADLWNVSTADAGLSHVASDTGGGVANGPGSIALARPRNTNEMTAVLVTAAGNLKLIAYDVTNTALVRAAERTESTVLAVSATTAPFSKGIVAAVRTQFGNLKVIAYETDAATGSIARRGDAAGAGPVKSVSVAATQAFQGVVTASCAGDDTLRIETFRVGPAGYIVNHDSAHSSVSTIDRVSVAWLGVRPDGKDLVMTAARRLDGTLWLASWAVGADGAIAQVGYATGGAISEVSIARVDATHAVTAMKDASGDLKLIAWHVKENGAVERRGEAAGGEASKMSIVDSASFYAGGPSFTATALRDDAGALRLIDWQVLLTD